MLQFSSHKLRCYNSAPIISDVTIQLPQSQMLQFSSHNLKFYNSTPINSDVTIQLPQNQVSQFNYQNLMCYNSAPTISCVTIQLPQSHVLQFPTNNLMTVLRMPLTPSTAHQLPYNLQSHSFKSHILCTDRYFQRHLCVITIPLHAQAIQTPETPSLPLRNIAQNVTNLVATLN